MNRKLLIIFGLLAVFRLVMTIGFLYDIPKISHNGLRFHQGGDQIDYFRVANSLSLSFNHIEKDKRPIGFSLVLFVFIQVFKASSWLELVPHIFWLNMVLFLFSIFLVGALSKKILPDDKTAIVSTVIWIIHPYIMYWLFLFDNNTIILRDNYINVAMWFPMLSDPLSASLVLLAIYWFLHEKKSGVWAGGAIGFAMLLRLQNIMIAIVFVAFLLKKSAHRKIVELSLTALVVFLPQLFYNTYLNGVFWKFGYTTDTEQMKILFSWRHLIAGIKFLLPVIGAVFLGGVAYIKSRNERMLLVLLLIIAYSLLCGSWWAFKAMPYRFIIPIIPLCIIVSVIGIQQCLNSSIRQKRLTPQTWEK